MDLCYIKGYRLAHFCMELYHKWRHMVVLLVHLTYSLALQVINTRVSRIINVATWFISQLFVTSYTIKQTPYWHNNTLISKQALKSYLHFASASVSGPLIVLKRTPAPALPRRHMNGLLMIEIGWVVMFGHSLHTWLLESLISVMMVFRYWHSFMFICFSMDL